MVNPIITGSQLSGFQPGYCHDEPSYLTLHHKGHIISRKDIQYQENFQYKGKKGINNLIDITTLNKKNACLHAITIKHNSEYYLENDIQP